MTEFSSPEIRQEAPPIPGLLVHPAELGLDRGSIDVEKFHRDAEALAGTPGVDLRALIDDIPHGDNTSTLVGKSDSGKSEIMSVTSSLLDVPHLDAGLLFRALAVQANEQGYDGGEISQTLADRLLSSVDEMTLTPGRPNKGLEQAVEVNGMRYLYSEMDSIDRGLITGVSQNDALYQATMERLVDETSGKLMIVGGRSVNQHIPNALAKFYIEREGVNGQDESGPTWTLDSPDSPGMMTIVNSPDKVKDSALAVSLIMARRVEARASDNTRYPLSLRGVSLVSGEPAKLKEVEAAIAGIDNVATNEAYMQNDIAPEFLEEMTSIIEAKASNARMKFPQDEVLMVESTALFIPKLHEMGLPPEVIEYMSKHNSEAIFGHIGVADNIDAYSVTVAAAIDKNGELATSLGLAKGRFQKESEGDEGFGWDAQFVPEGYDRTYAAMGDNKHLISSRASATAQFLRK